MKEKDFLLDSDTLSYYLKNHASTIQHWLSALQKGKKMYCTRLSFYEIVSGLAYKDAHNKKEKFLALFPPLEVLELDEPTSLLAATIYANLRKKGVNVGDIDILNAATSIIHQLKMVTNNTKHYKDIADIDLENWVS